MKDLNILRMKLSEVKWKNMYLDENEKIYLKDTDRPMLYYTCMFDIEERIYQQI